MPTVKALNNLNIRVHVHTKGQMPKQLPLPGLDFTHTRMHPQIEYLNYCNAIRTWHPPLHTCFQWHPHWPATLPSTCQAVRAGRVAGLDDVKAGTFGKLPISVTLHRSTASHLLLCELYTGWFLVCFRALFLADSDNWNSHCSFSVCTWDIFQCSNTSLNPLVCGVNT